MVVALASHGISYTFDQVDAMTGYQREALVAVLRDRVAEQEAEARKARNKRA